MVLELVTKEDCSIKHGPKSTHQRKKIDIPILNTRKRCHICGNEDGNLVECYNNRGKWVKHYLCNDCKDNVK